MLLIAPKRSQDIGLYFRHLFYYLRQMIEVKLSNGGNLRIGKKKIPRVQNQNH